MAKVVKIADFGLAIAIKDQEFLVAMVGTVFYNAPEAHGGKYFYPSDIWALGCTLFETAYGPKT